MPDSPATDNPAADNPVTDNPATDNPVTDNPVTETGDAARPAPADTALSQERRDLLRILTSRRHFLRHTARELTDEQARSRSTVSELTIGGLIKHVAWAERVWAQFILEGPSAHARAAESAGGNYADGFRLLPDETLAGVLADYETVAARTDEIVRTADLDAGQPLPEAPWFAKESWTARQVLLHIATETAQHSGHADIIREAIDGAKTMG